ncbi:hypothetical protein RchiOBHm_Chr3g0479681 [Rosa chinensis]|uniref:Uncharacterized protein n=1 Tax=Rosa chinensis TaxID=74649 RepID=A0A2P6RDH9_ROSCH|nr:uncharacterized protein LOC112192178 [Rosa chinensis]PRQ44476.1 hypothetical protein RchiOBHm_Chr3g0479681 [Rosa chinensis]
MDPPTSIPTTATATATASASVQHVTKRSSDELLRKFADSCNEAEASARKKAIRELSKQRKKSRKSGEFDQSESASNGKSSSLVERRSLLPVVAGTKNKGLLLRQLGVHGRSRDIRNKSLFGTIHKTWRRTIEGASKVFMEKHYNRHRRLINDIV